MKRLFFFAYLLLLCCVGQAQQASFVFVKIPEALMPVARGTKYEDPLDALLSKAKLGEVTGGGSSVGKDGRVAWVGIDVELANLTRGLPFLRQALIKLGVPRGTTIEYESNGARHSVAVHDGG